MKIVNGLAGVKCIKCKQRFPSFEEYKTHECK